MTPKRPLGLRLAHFGAAAALLSSCGSISFLTDEADTVTGTDETALRDAAVDAFDAVLDRDHARVAAYVDPACGVTTERVRIALDEGEAFLQEFAEFFEDFDSEDLDGIDPAAFEDVTFSDIFSSARVTDASIDAMVGKTTIVTDTNPAFDGFFDEPSESEWHAVDGRWVTIDCTEYLSFEEQEALGYPTNVRFEADGSVTVLEAETDENTVTDSEPVAPELVLESAPEAVPTAGTGLDDAFGSDQSGDATDVAVPATAPATTTPTITAAPAPSTTAAPAPPPTAAPTPVKLDPGLIVASVSSELPPFRELSYGASNLFDGVLETAWNHCGDCTGNSGVGQRISIGFTQPVTVVGIRIANGYQKETNDVFFGNNRVAQMTVSTLEATVSETLELADAKGYQLFSLPTTTTTGLFLDIDAIHAGTDYPDLAVSEIEVFVLP